MGSDEMYVLGATLGMQNTLLKRYPYRLKTATNVIYKKCKNNKDKKMNVRMAVEIFLHNLYQ